MLEDLLHQSSGDYDYANWGDDSANLVFGNSDPLLEDLGSSNGDLLGNSSTDLSGFDAAAMHNILSPEGNDANIKNDGNGIDNGGAVDGGLSATPEVEALNSTVDPTEQEMDQFLVDELNHLSMKDRERAMHDLHGVSDIVVEDKAFVDSCLLRLDSEISRIGEKDAYLLAESANSSYVGDRSLRLKFLRADSFDPKLAAERYVKWFENKLELFGSEMLTRDIKMSDLSESEVRSLETGYIQILSERDRAGRAIICAVRSGMTENLPLESRVSIPWVPGSCCIKKFVADGFSSCALPLCVASSGLLYAYGFCRR